MRETFDTFAAETIKTANNIAHEYEQEYVGTEHVLLAIAQDSGGLGSAVLRSRGLTYNKIKAEVDSLIQRSMEETWVFGRLPGSPHFKNVVARAIEEAQRLKAERIGTEHLLLGLLHEQGGVAQAVLNNLGLQVPDVRKDIVELSKAGRES